jgi:1-acyl-sn-glycerol-3-phosphate acyltransferase
VTRPPPGPLEEKANRLVRVGKRIAATGVSALAANGRLRRLHGGPLAAIRRERALLLRDFFGQLCRLHGVEVSVSGARPCGEALLASNHLSYLDPIAIGSVLPCVPVSKLDVADWPIIGTLARELGVLFVNRGDSHSGMRVLRGAVRAFADRLPVLNFPEGTTTMGETVLPFRAGLFGLAIRNGVPVVPVSLQYDPPEAAWVGDAKFLPHYLRMAGEDRIRVQIHFGPALEPASFPTAGEMAHAAHGLVLEQLGGHHVAAVGT